VSDFVVARNLVDIDKNNMRGRKGWGRYAV
jgi:hypothetical protein